MAKYLGPQRADQSYVESSDPAEGGFAVAPDNGNDLAEIARAIYIGTGGDLKVTAANGAVLTFVGVPQGIILPVRVKRVWATGTTASYLIGLV